MKRRLLATLAAASVTMAGLVTGTAHAATAGPDRPSTPHAQELRSALRNGTLVRTAGKTNVCATHRLRCQAEMLTLSKRSRTAISQSRASAVGPMTIAPPIGYSPKELQKAYGLTSASSRTGTIVVIGAGAYPTLESDLAIYRSAFHLPSCTKANGCFRQMNYLGGAPYKPSKGDDNQFGEEEIAVETALDVDMASAACPKCHIISMQVPLLDGFYGTKKQTHNAILHFATGVRTAKKLGADAVSISYGYPTDSYSDKGTVAALMNQPGMAIVSSSGDDGFLADEGQWPQSLRTVTSAGGTSLYVDKSATRGYREVAWNGAGSGCSADLAAAVGQPAVVSKACHRHRAASDISAVADPYTGVAVYDSYAPFSGMPYGFIVVGGTSASSPFLAGLYARAPRNKTVVGPNTVYAAPSWAFHDVTIGTNAGVGLCRAMDYSNNLCDSAKGWDGPTGLGTPSGLRPFTTSAKR
jgi:subtilase family serine protease